MKRSPFTLSALIVFMVILGSGCSESVNPVQAPVSYPGPAPVRMEVENPCGLVTTVTLFAGQTIDVGTVVIANDGDNLCVTYNTTGDWYLTENHLDIALSPEEIPQTNSGNPRPGQFSYSHILSIPVQSDSYCFTLADLGYIQGQVLYVAAHSRVVRMSGGRVVQTETAWGDGEQFPGANWATYMTHTIQICQGGGGE
jgi:hypothetical protein